jgi:hypothetical protein
MDWAPVLTVIATGVVTLGGVWLNGKFSERTEARRQAEDRRRESDRVHREELADAAAQSTAQEIKAHALADEIAGLFLDEMREVRQHSQDKDSAFTPWFNDRWKTTGDIRLRRAIGRIAEPHDRSRLMQMLDALDDYEALATWDFSTAQPKVEEFLALAFDLAATMARGQEPDSDLTARFERFQKDVREQGAYQEEQAELKRELWREEAEDRKKKKAAAAESAAQDDSGF